MKNLLLPFDGSECATRALDFAVSLAKAMPPATVHVVYAYVEPMASAYGEVAVSRRATDSAIVTPANVGWRLR
jgi:nucleotide-binding universal stress UspA family protein